MANISVLNSMLGSDNSYAVPGTAGNTYFDQTTGGDAYFRGTVSLSGDITLIGSVGGTAVSGRGNVFDFSQISHLGQKVVAYGSTVSWNWADGVDEFVGGRFDDTVVARASAGSDQKFWTGDGQDTFWGAQGVAKSYIDMGAGFDIAYVPEYVGNFSQAPTVSHWATSNVWEIKHFDGGVTQIDNAEAIIFANLAVFSDGLALDSHMGQAYRIYQAGLDRTPDLKGLVYWADQLSQGTSMASVAQGFLSSDEGKVKFGGGNADFVTKVYENVLHRAPELDGGSYWLGKLDKGELTRADVLAAFADSNENAAALVKTVGHAFTLDDNGHIGTLADTGFNMW